MSQHQCAVNIIIVIAAVILLTYVSAWYTRKEIKYAFAKLTFGWLVILGGVFCFWETIVLFVRAVNKLAK